MMHCAQRLAFTLTCVEGPTWYLSRLQLYHAFWQIVCASAVCPNLHTPEAIYEVGHLFSWDYNYIVVPECHTWRLPYMSPPQRDLGCAHTVPPATLVESCFRGCEFHHRHRCPASPTACYLETTTLDYGKD